MGRGTVNRRSDHIRRDLKLRWEKRMICEAQLSGICSLLIIILGLLYLMDALRNRWTLTVMRNRWTLTVIIVLAVIMNAMLILHAREKRRAPSNKQSQ